MHRLKRTHLFGDALAFGIDACGIEWVRSTEIILWNVREAGRLFAVDGPRTGQKKLAGRMRFGKPEHLRSAVDDGRKPIERRLFGGLPPACLGSGVEDVWKVAIRKGEAANISRVKSEGRIGGKMRALHREGRGVARQDRGASVEVELPIDIGEAFQQPAPEKAGAPCYEN